MSQLDFLNTFADEIFTRRDPQRAPETEQEQELRRVTGRIANLVQQFFDGLEVNQRFHMEDLTRFVQFYATCSPDSPRRVAREMNATGQVAFRLITRAKSLYVKTGAGCGK